MKLKLIGGRQMNVHLNSDLLNMPLQNMMAKEKAGDSTLQTAPEQPQKIVFKKDSFESYRDRITNGSSFDEVKKQRDFLLNAKLSPDINYSFTLSERINKLNVSDKETSTNGILSSSNILDNIMNAYTSLYDEIVQGYKNGTRVINISDLNSNEGYRTLTLQEELDDLDKAYEKAVNTAVSLLDKETDIQISFDKYYEKLQRIGEERADFAKEYANKETSVKFNADDILHKMISERDVWRTSYAKQFGLFVQPTIDIKA
ncbi:MAG: hypothetical protein IJX15_06480 [Ruminiclostridium sp.]|nr:hypothetical protein [Ruminiclostridium sp.]